MGSIPTRSGYAAGVDAPRMSSREIATLTGKRHPDVRRDIHHMLSELEEDAPSFRRTYRDSMNREQTEYLLPKRETLILVSGYNLAMRAAIIDRWQELEAKQQQAPVLPDFTNPAIAARAWADEVEQKLALECKVQEMSPKVEVYDAMDFDSVPI